MVKENIQENLVSQSIDQIMNDRFGRYAKYIIQQRALPDARDGLKPVQRRILYSMYELNLHHDKPFKKSARVVGDVIGKYHPHGDSSIYEAMVRMSQPWKMNIPLVQMHGNIGSIDDDPAAAMRYTEARLSKISTTLLADLAKNSVKFAPNFDDSEKEPTVLPALIPNLLINGTKGIASGFATDMPPHNISEIINGAIAKIKNPEIPLHGLMKYIKGPDFPTGGIIMGNEGIEHAFERGQGRVILVSKKTNSQDNKFKYIEVTEIPYGVVKSKLVYDIDSLIQRSDIGGIIEVRDQSDREGISILIKLELSANEDTIWKYLLSKTELQVYYNYNNVAIVNNAPRLMGLNGLLDAYINHVKDVKYATIKYDLDKCTARLEIVDGFIKVAKILNEVIETIRKADNSRQGVIESLITKFDFTKNQATAIADMRLYRLSHTDQNLYISEREELLKNIEFFNKLILDQVFFNEWLIEILTGIKNEFGVERHTKIETEETFDRNYNEADLIKEEETYVAVSADGYIKRFSKNIYDSNKLENYGIKEKDYLIYMNKLQTTTVLLIFTDLGRYAYLPVYKVNESKWKDLGVHFSELVDFKAEESIVSIIPVQSFDILAYVVSVTKEGLIKRMKTEDLVSTRFNSLSNSTKLKKGDYVVNVCLTNGEQDVLIVTKNGLAAKYSENDVPIYGRTTQGVKALNINTDDYVTSMSTTSYDEEVILITQENSLKRIKVSDIQYSSKKVRGKPIFLQKKTSPYVVKQAFSIKNTKNLIAKDSEKNLFELKSTEIPLTNTQEGFKKMKNYNLEGITVLSTNIVDANDELFSSVKISKVEKAQVDEQKFEKAEKKLAELNDEMDIDEMIKRINQSLK